MNEDDDVNVNANRDGNGMDADRQELGTAEDAAHRRANWWVAEILLGARRVMAPGDVCALQLEGRRYACFGGHWRYDDPAWWARHYAGPDVGADPALARRAEAALVAAAARGGVGRALLAAYVKSLAARVYPAFDEIEAEADVIDFWFALAHAAPRDRVAALAQTLAPPAPAPAGADDESPEGWDARPDLDEDLPTP